MISKKSRKVVAALLIGATICASGTFAYFNARTDLKNVEGLADNAQKTLNITNGKIEISGKMAGSEGGDLSSLWGYDVARVSTIKSLINDTNGNFSKEITKNFGFNSTNVLLEGKYNLKAFNTTLLNNNTEPASNYPNYVDTNRSLDIVGLANDGGDTDGSVTTAKNAYLDAKNAYENRTDDTDEAALKTAMENAQKAYQAAIAKNVRDNRAAIGEGVVSAINKARPGDAFVLGGVDGVDIDKAGIEIDNKSNLTTKIGIRFNTKNSDVKATQDQIKAMNANGWKVYVKVVDPTDTDSKGISPFAEWTEIDWENINADNDFVCKVATVKPGQAAPKLQMRVELPLDTVNYYQDRSTGNGIEGLPTEFDIANMFEIIATQENNPGWAEDGTTPTGDAGITPSETTKVPVGDKVNK